MSLDSKGQLDSGFLMKISGTSVPFFISPSQLHDGFTLSNWSKIKLTYDDLDITASATTGWLVQVIADRSSIRYMGSVVGAPDIDLSSLGIRVEDIQIITTTGSDDSVTGDKFNETQVVLSVPILTSVTYSNLIKYNFNKVSKVELEITLSYDLGLDGSLFGKAPGMYYVNLDFNLISTP